MSVNETFKGDDGANWNVGNDDFKKHWRNLTEMTTILTIMVVVRADKWKKQTFQESSLRFHLIAVRLISNNNDASTKSHNAR